MKAIFKSGLTLHLMLTKVKFTLPLKKQSIVVYQIPCTCGKIYIGETKRRRNMKIKEHHNTCGKGLTSRSAIAEHAWKNHHPIEWEGVSVVDQARAPKELALKEALHIQLIPSEEFFNQDVRIELPYC